MVAVITLLDDLDAATGTQTPAEKKHKITHNGRSVEIDLSAAHGDELTKLLLPYFECGQVQRGSGREATRGQGVTSVKLSRAEAAAMRAWAKSQGISYVSPGGSTYYSSTLRRAWNEHKEAEGLSFDDD
jgi:hypothetical protein